MRELEFCQVFLDFIFTLARNHSKRNGTRTDARKSKAKSKATKNGSQKDISSKTIFRNHVLCCQFLKDNIDFPLMKHLKPENIEDHTERFNSYFGVEYSADTVKRILIPDNDEEFEFYLISLIEHKSQASVGRFISADITSSHSCTGRYSIIY